MDCLGRLSELDLLKTFNLGAVKVVILVGKDHECKNGQAVERLMNRVESINNRLSAAGIEKRIVVEEIEAK